MVVCLCTLKTIINKDVSRRHIKHHPVSARVDVEGSGVALRLFVDRPLIVIA
jgi:hypothetical protein